MKKLLIVFFAICLQMPHAVKGQNYNWAKGIGGVTDYDIGTSITHDSLGNVYITGTFRDTVDFDPGPSDHNLSTTSSLRGVFVLKLDSSGNYLWAKKIDGGTYNEATSISLDISGNILVSGYYVGTNDFDPGSATSYMSTSGNGYWTFILKLNTNGNYIWVKVFGGINCSCVNSGFVTDAIGSIFITGSFSGSGSIIDFDPGPGSTNDTSSIYDPYQMYISKFDSSGNFIWRKKLKGQGDLSVCGIVRDYYGNLITVGTFIGTTDFDPNIGMTNLTSAGQEDIYILKLDSNGFFLWAKSISGTNSERSFALCIDRLNNVYTSGEILGTVDFDPGIGTYTSSPAIAGTQAVFVSKYDPSGNFVWVKQINSTFANYGCLMKLDKDENLYTAGSFSGTTDFDPGPGIKNISSTGYCDMYISKLDNQGDFIWVKILNGNGWSSAITPCSITIDKAGNIFSTGLLMDTVDFDPDAGIENLYSHGLHDLDIFISKLGMCNTLLKTTSNQTLCIGETVTITANGAYTYTWHPGSINTQSLSLSPTSSITYSVSGKKSDDCVGISEVKITVDPCTGIYQNSVNENLIKVYPNPNNGDFIVIYTEALNIKLVNELGQVLRIIELNDSNAFTTIISNLIAGIYFLSSEKGTEKIVVLN